MQYPPTMHADSSIIPYPESPLLTVSLQHDGHARTLTFSNVRLVHHAAFGTSGGWAGVRSRGSKGVTAERGEVGGGGVTAERGGGGIGVIPSGCRGGELVLAVGMGHPALFAIRNAASLASPMIEPYCGPACLPAAFLPSSA